jgi:tetratricopeptide (TPR) repeat protein
MNRMNELNSAAANKRKLLAGAVVIIAACFLAYMPAMHAGFVWDDDRYVTNNELLAAPDGFWRIWLTTESPSQYFPLTYTSFRLEYDLWKLNPAGYHITNIILHAANALLVWVLLRRLTIPGAWLIAAIFALHPVQVESVAWITERKNVLMVFFALLSFIAWVDFAERSRNLQPSRHFYFLSLLFYVLALAAKSTACTVPAALLLVLWLKNIPVNWKRWLQIVPFLLLGLATGLLAVWWELHHQGTKFAKLDFSLIDRFLIASRALWFYIGKLIWPVNLAFSYPKWEIDATDSLQYSWLAACSGVAFALWYWRRKIGKGTIVAVVFFAATLSPVIGFISLYTFVYTYVADHYQYFASIGPIALVAAAGVKIFSNLNEQNKNIAKIITGMLLVTLGTLTWHQCRVYKDEETLYRDTVLKNPSSWMAYNNLGAVYSNLGRYEDAIEAYKQAIRVKPDFAIADVGLGAVYSKLDRYEDAIEAHKQAIRINPNYATARYNLGAIYGKLGRYQEAIEACKQAIRINPAYADAYYNLGVIYGKLGHYPEAIEAYKQTIKIKSDDAAAYNNLGDVCNNLDRHEDAIEAYKCATRIKPDLAEAYGNLGFTYGKLGRHKEAIVAFKQAIERSPDYADAYYNMGVMYWQQGQFNEVVEACRDAIKIKPDYVEAYYVLGLCYMALNEKSLAMEEYKILKTLDEPLADELFKQIHP